MIITDEAARIGLKIVDCVFEGVKIPEEARRFATSMGQQAMAMQYMKETTAELPEGGGAAAAGIGAGVGIAMGTTIAKGMQAPAQQAPAQQPVVLCQKCGTPYYCKTGQKTKVCNKCGHRIRIKAARILSSADTSVEARYLLEAFKVPESQREEIINLISSAQDRKPLKNEEILDHFIYGYVLKQDQARIPESLFFQLLNEKGLPSEWIKRELERLIQQGLVIRPQKGILKFIS